MIFWPWIWGAGGAPLSFGRGTRVSAWRAAPSRPSGLPGLTTTTTTTTNTTPTTTTSSTTTTTTTTT
eukprot:15950870-Heterocapsa_arctica.AAC.1